MLQRGSEKEKAIFRKCGEHRFQIPDGSRWGDVKAASTNLGEVLTKAMRAVANANDELRGVFTVDWNQPAPDGHGGPASDKKRSSAKGTRGAQNNKDDSQR